MGLRALLWCTKIEVLGALAFDQRHYACFCKRQHRWTCSFDGIDIDHVYMVLCFAMLVCCYFDFSHMPTSRDLISMALCIAMLVCCYFVFLHQPTSRARR